VRVGEFDIPGLRKVRDQLWAEATHRIAQGESIRLKQELYAVAATYQNDRRVEDPWEDIIKSYSPERKTVRHTKAELYDIVGVTSDRQTTITMSRLYVIVKQLGFKHTTYRVGKTVMRGWIRKPKPYGDLFVDEE
jgi:predicted P-loop ATPase